MPKKIVLLSDGIGNSVAKAHRTNVWRLYRTLDVTKGDQIALYDDGVGSQQFLPFRILGGVFGWVLKRNVLDLYSFLCLSCAKAARIWKSSSSLNRIWKFTARFRLLGSTSIEYLSTCV